MNAAPNPAIAARLQRSAVKLDNVRTIEGPSRTLSRLSKIHVAGLDSSRG